MQEEETSAAQLIQAALEVARQPIPGPGKPVVDQEAAPEVSYQSRAMARAIELAGPNSGIEAKNLR